MTHKTATTILDLDAKSARELLMDPNAFCTIPLPGYFNFKRVLEAAQTIQPGYSERTRKADNDSGSPSLHPPGVRSIFNGVNYTILSNKDGQISWRPLEIMNPVLYTDLAYKITECDNWKFVRERFQKFQINGCVECCSMPSGQIDPTQKASIYNWWNRFEMRSIELALEYPVQIQTDISECYGSLYTHTIVWALHDKEKAKKTRDTRLLGNYIDTRLMDMSSGQTNGIPQGSILSDFLVEIVLGYADLLLSERLKEATDDRDQNPGAFTILRYRDDYRIFAKTREKCQELLLELMQVLASLNFKLGGPKTILTDDVVLASVKRDKVNWMKIGCRPRDLHKHLLLLAEFSRDFPQSGTLSRELSSFYQEVKNRDDRPIHNTALISQITDILIRNPRCYPIGCAILSQLLRFEKSGDRALLLERILHRCKAVPNRGMFEIWLQRISWKDTLKTSFKERLCNCIPYREEHIPNPWNFEWLTQKDRELMESMSVVDFSDLGDFTSSVISLKEVRDINDYED